jgi:hypothetical protein
VCLYYNLYAEHSGWGDDTVVKKKKMFIQINLFLKTFNIEHLPATTDLGLEYWFLNPEITSSNHSGTARDLLHAGQQISPTVKGIQTHDIRIIYQALYHCAATTD